MSENTTAHLIEEEFEALGDLAKDRLSHLDSCTECRAVVEKLRAFNPEAGLATLLLRSAKTQAGQLQTRLSRSRLFAAATGLALVFGSLVAVSRVVSLEKSLEFEERRAASAEAELAVIRGSPARPQLLLSYEGTTVDAGTRSKPERTVSATVLLPRQAGDAGSAIGSYKWAKATPSKKPTAAELIAFQAKFERINVSTDYVDIFGISPRLALVDGGTVDLDSVLKGFELAKRNESPASKENSNP